MRVTVWPLLACVLALPVSGSAEGAVTVLSCTLDQVCDATGACIAIGAPFRFELSPQSVDAAGAGGYAITYSNPDGSVEQGPLPMTASSRAGPFLWQDDGVDYTMTLQPGDAATPFVVQAIVLADDPASSGDDDTLYMTCDVTQ